MLEAKKLRWHAKPKNKRQEKDSALRKMKIDDKKEWLRKTGKLDDYTDSYGRVKIKIKK